LAASTSDAELAETLISGTSGMSANRITGGTYNR
jgi:hypothetical protein